MSIVTFSGDDSGFHDWLDNHQADGFFLNPRGTDGQVWMLHEARCHHFDRSPGIEWTKTKKQCSPSEAELAGWVRKRGGELLRCRTCFG